MLDVTALFRGVNFTLEKIVAPLTMLWFAGHWAHVPPDTSHPANERKSAIAGVTVGLFLALPIILLVFSLFDLATKSTGEPLQTSFPDNHPIASFLQSLSTSAFRHWIVGFVGTLILGGVIGGFTTWIREKVLETQDVAGKTSIRHPYIWLSIVAVTTAVTVVSLTVYYAGPPYGTWHFNLMWGYLSLLIGYRIIAAIKAMTEN